MDYLETDEQHDVLVSLKETLHQVSRTPTDPHCWKWAIIALVCATSGACVCNLTGSMGIGALKTGSRKKMIEALQNPSDSALPDVMLHSPKDLLQSVESSERADPGAGRAISFSEEQRRMFTYLVTLRNGYMHFQPLGWSIAVNRLPSVFMEVLGIVEAISQDGHSVRHLNELDQEELRATCSALREVLTRMASQSDPSASSDGARS